MADLAGVVRGLGDLPCVRAGPVVDPRAPHVGAAEDGRDLFRLGEDVIGVTTPSEVLNRLSAALPKVLGISGVHLYLYNRSTKELDRVLHSADAAFFSVPVQAAEGSLPLGPAVSFRNQALLTIPDTRRSPFLRRAGGAPGSATFVLMFAESEILGVPRCTTSSLSTNSRATSES